MSLLSSNRPFRVGIVRGATVKHQTIRHNVADQLPASINTQNDIAAQRRRKLQEGYDQGYQDGLQQAYAQVEEETARWVESCRFAVNALLEAGEQLRTREETSLAQVVDQTAALSMLLAENIIEKEISEMSDPGRHAIARLIGQLPEEGDIRIRMCSQDIETLGNIEDLILGREVQFIPDDSLSSGSAILQAQASTVDGCIDRAIERAKTELR